MEQQHEPGTLFLVSTPIGNLEDMTFRAVRILREADLIAAEDTRRTGRLLQHYDIENRQTSLHDHNKKTKTPRLLDRLQNGETIAVVSDAGTPAISDPAFYLVREAVSRNLPVSPVPGPSASIAALICSGIPTDRFVFEGFLPVKKKRRKRLTALSREKRTIILYESPHRVLRTMKDIHEYLGNRDCCIGRELTKKFEEFIHGTAAGVIKKLEQREIKGEMVIIISGEPKKDSHGEKN